MLPPMVHLGQATAEGPAPDGPRWVGSTQPRPGHQRLSRIQALASAPAKCFLEISSVQ